MREVPVGHIAVLIATGLYSGYGPKIKKQALGGTWGSIAATLVCLCVLWYGSIWIYIAATILIFVLGILSVPLAEEVIGPERNDKGIEVTRDQNSITIDEWLGVFVSLSPISLMDPSWWMLIPAGFGLAMFRAFDIAKPLGISRLDQIKNSFGVMIDDALAGLYSIPTTLGVAAVTTLVTR